MSSKRKSSASMSLNAPTDDDHYDDYESDVPAGSMHHRKSIPKQSGAGGNDSMESNVTKRTLQNRKAQREFRKRREARVRDLEERCRRFDQMGLEANVELQRVARNLKEENEALRGFVIRIGYGNMMPTILEGTSNNNSQLRNDGSFQSAFAGDFGGAESSKGKDGTHMYNGIHHDPSRTKMPTSAPAHQTTFPTSSFANDAWMDDGAYERKASNDDAVQPSPSSDASSTSSQNGPLLSLNLNQATNQGGKQQTQPEFTTTTQDDSSRSRLLSTAAISPNTAMNNLLGQMGSQMNGNMSGAGMSGSAMLGNYAQNSPRGYQNSANSNNQLYSNAFTPYPVPQRAHQNDALLNPNPIPFAFNLSNDPPQPTSSWWEQMGGTRFTPGQETSELDEKAQAVAAAQTNNGGPQSPFDLSAFLQGGMTPGGGFNLSSFLPEATSGEEKGTAVASGSGNGDDTDHMRIFVQLLERKVAEREAQTVASLGFQPPSQDPSQRTDKGGQDTGSDKPKISFTSALTPSRVYSRLAEHPAFLSTDARELEELVDALGTGAARSPGESVNSTRSGRSQASSKQKSASPAGPQPTNKQKFKYDGSVTASSSSVHGKASDSGTTKSPSGSVEVDEHAIQRLLGLLDQKRIASNKEQLNGHTAEHLTMAMT